MTQDQTLTSSARNPMLEQLIENGIECLDKAENTSEDWLYDLYMADALKEFRSAVEIAPDEPWLWFQIGWLNLIDNAEIDDPEPIRTALQRALVLKNRANKCEGSPCAGNTNLTRASSSHIESFVADPELRRLARCEYYR